MFCTKCGAQIEPGHKFCTKCGAPVGGAPVGAAPVNAQPAMPMQPVKKVKPAKPAKPAGTKKKIWPFLLIAAGILAVLLIVAIIAYNRFSSGDGLADDADVNEELTEETTANYDVSTFNLDELSESDDADEALDNVYDQVGVEHVSYAYSDVYDMGESVLIKPNGNVSDNTVIWNGKDLGGFCDFIDNDVYAGERQINRDMLYQLISIHVIDPSIVSSDHIFEILMKYCLIVTAEFGDSGSTIEGGSFTKEHPNTYNDSMNIDGKDSTWVIDYDNYKVLLNDGKTEYTSSGEYGMFTENTMAVWTYVIDEYFGIN